MPLTEEFITYIYQEKGACRATQGHMGKHGVWSRGRKEEGKAWAEVFLGFPWKRQDRAGKPG